MAALSEKHSFGPVRHGQAGAQLITMPAIDVAAHSDFLPSWRLRSAGRKKLRDLDHEALAPKDAVHSSKSYDIAVMSPFPQLESM